MVKVVAPRGFRDRIRWRDPIHRGRCEATNDKGLRCVNHGAHLHEIDKRSTHRMAAFTWDNCRWICAWHHARINAGLIDKPTQRAWPIEPEPGDGYGVLPETVG